MTKYYKVIKNHPCWEEGAIIRDSDDYVGYMPIEDIWTKKREFDTMYEGKEIVEGCPEFFQRIYKSDLDKLIFHTADELKKAYDKIKYKLDK